MSPSKVTIQLERAHAEKLYNYLENIQQVEAGLSQNRLKLFRCVMKAIKKGCGWL